MISFFKFNFFGFIFRAYAKINKLKEQVLSNKQKQTIKDVLDAFIGKKKLKDALTTVLTDTK